MLGGTSGRTTLNGEGLQHEDGHSHILAGTIPNCVSYDPTFAYEVVTIIRDGMRRMYEQQEDVYYYVTLMNENYTHPEMPEGAAEGIVKGMYLLKDAGKAKKGELRVQLLGSGTILREVIAAVVEPELRNVSGHRQMVSAIRAGDAPAAERAAKALLETSSEEWAQLLAALE